MNELTYLDIHNRFFRIDDLWVALSPIEVESSAKADVLSNREQKIYHKFENSSRKREFIGARAVLQNMAAEAGYDVNRFELKKTTQGRPYGVAGTDTLLVSIAHTDRYVLCGLSRMHKIGVDLEPADRKIHKRLRGRILTDLEADNPRLNPDRLVGVC